MDGLKRGMNGGWDGEGSQGMGWGDDNRHLVFEIKLIAAYWLL